MNQRKYRENEMFIDATKAVKMVCVERQSMFFFFLKNWCIGRNLNRTALIGSLSAGMCTKMQRNEVKLLTLTSC